MLNKDFLKVTDVNKSLPERFGYTNEQVIEFLKTGKAEGVKAKELKAQSSKEALDDLF